MKRKLFVGAVALCGMIAVSPIISYASGVTFGTHSTTSVGAINTMVGGTKKVQIYASDIDYLAGEIKSLITRRNSVQSRLADVADDISHLSL